MGVDQLILQKIHTLLPEKQYEVLDFVEFLASKVNPASQPKSRFQSLKQFRAALPPSQTNAAKLVSQMRDEEDKRF